MNIVLGGTRGLGLEIATLLKGNGEETFVVGRSYTASEHGAGAAVDFAKPNDMHELIAAIEKWLGSAKEITVYWCAGVGYAGDFADQPNAAEMATVNFAGPLQVVQALWQQMLARGGMCRLAIVSSTTGVKPRANEAVYAATKHAQVGLARSLGLESERLGANIHVSLFMPGGMQTPFWDDIGRPAVYDEFLDPKKVAAQIVSKVNAQAAPYYEETIERGSL